MMKRLTLKGLAGKVAGFTALALLASASFAQTFTAGTDGAQPGNTATIPISYDSDGTVANLVIQITFDDAILTADLSNCLESVEEPHASNPFTTCTEVAAGSISVTLNDNGNAEFVTQTVGTIGFAIDAGATTGTTEPIGVIIQDVTDTSGNTVPTNTVASVDGAVDIQAGPPAVLEVTPSSIDFGSVISPGTATDTVTIANTGMMGAPDLDVTALNFSDAVFSAVGGSCGMPTFSVAAQDSCTVDVEFSAAAVQAYAGDLDVVSSVGTESVDLSGEGTAGPVASFAIDPATAAFGQVDLNDMPEAIVHTVTNDGDAGSTLELNDLSYAGDPEFSIGTVCPATLSQNETCTVTVTFDSASVGGPFAGTVTAQTNVGTFDVPVTGEAVASANVTVDPPFGPVNLGTAGAGETLTADGLLSNTGSADAEVSCVFTNNPNDYFSSDPSPLAATVPAGGEVPFQLSCMIPQDAEDGDVFEATLECSVDGAVAGTHNLSCSTQNFMAIPVNTLQPWALALFALMMLLAGGIGIRFFRAN